MSRLFVSQELLDQWSGEGKIELEGNLLKLINEGRFFEIQPGVRFVKVAAGEDRKQLNCKVKTEAQMPAMGAELYMNSVLVGEDAYDVQTGFLCEVPSGAAQAIAPPGAGGSPDSQVPKGAPKTADERSMLAQFLLENLS
jgi:hypothetical protein